MITSDDLLFRFFSIIKYIPGLEISILIRAQIAVKIQLQELIVREVNMDVVWMDVRVNLGACRVKVEEQEAENEAE